MTSLSKPVFNGKPEQWFSCLRVTVDTGRRLGPAPETRSTGQGSGSAPNRLPGGFGTRGSGTRWGALPGTRLRVCVCVCVCACAHSRSVVSNSLQPQGLYIARQAPLSMGFSSQEYWRVLPFPPPGDLPTGVSNPHLPRLLHRQAGSLLLSLWEAPDLLLHRGEPARRSAEARRESCLRTSAHLSRRSHSSPPSPQPFDNPKPFKKLNYAQHPPGDGLAGKCPFLASFP